MEVVRRRSVADMWRYVGDLWYGFFLCLSTCLCASKDL